MMHWDQKIRDKYNLSKGLKTRQVVNRAIREEITGGGECLDAMEHFTEMLNSLHSSRRQDVPNIQQMIDIVGVALDRLNGIRDAMGDEILGRYQ